MQTFYVMKHINFKNLLIIIFFTYNLQLHSIADDIRDFQIEGMSLGDSLLKFYSENEIKKQLSKTKTKRTNTDIKRVYFDISNPVLYGTVNIHFKNNENYKIVSIGGIEYFKNDMVACYDKQNQVIQDIEKTFPNADKSNLKIAEHTSDPTGKSNIKDIWFDIEGGQVYISCTDWSDDITEKYTWTDNLGVYLDTYEYIEWLSNLKN